MDDAVVTVPELLELLAVSIKHATMASENMRFDFFDPQQRVCIGFLQAIIEYARAIHMVASQGMYYAPTTMHRAALDAYVDIVNVCKDREYCEHLEAADALSWKRLLERASAGRNPLLKAIAEAEHFEDGRRMYSDTVRELEARGVKKLEPADRFKLAEMTDEYEAAYAMLSAEAHNNVSFVTNHYFVVSTEEPALRPFGSTPGNGAPKATVLNMAEIVLSATEKVLRLCRHGTAILSPARYVFEGIHARLVAAYPDAAIAPDDGTELASGLQKGPKLPGA